MDVSLLEQLVRLMSANDLNTLDLREGTKRVVLKRGAVATPPQASIGFAMPHPAHAAPQATHLGPASGAATPPAAGHMGAGPAAPVEEAGLIPIKSPMVGTFYSSASPDAKPFVAVGTEVDEETDVCIIEAMKVFNNIKAECRGSIASVLIENGETVEFGQTLFLVKPG